MSRIAENKALEIYPDIEINWTMMDRTKERMIYADGYDQAMQDFMEKACDWLSKQPMSRPVFWTVEDFKNYMEEEL